MILDAASAVISRNRNRKDKRLWTDQQGGDADRLRPRRRRNRGGRLHHPRRSAKRSGSRSDAMIGGAVPHERPVARDRRRADARGRRLPHHRRRPVLRAQGNQGRARLPAPAHQPARRRELPARGERAGARHRQDASSRRSTRSIRGGRRRGHAAARWPVSSRRRRRGRSGRGSLLALERRQLPPRALAALKAFRDLARRARRRRRRRERLDRASALCSIASGYLQDLRDETQRRSRGAASRT